MFGMLAALGFILLLMALGAPLIAYAGVVVTGLSAAGAFGVARLIFQDGHLAGLLITERRRSRRHPHRRERVLSGQAAQVGRWAKLTAACI